MCIIVSGTVVIITAAAALILIPVTLCLRGKMHKKVPDTIGDAAQGINQDNFELESNTAYVLTPGGDGAKDDDGKYVESSEVVATSSDDLMVYYELVQN